MATKKRSTEVIIDTKITNEAKEIEKSKQKTIVFKDDSSDTLISFSNSTDKNKFIRVLKDDDGKTFVEFESSMFVDNHGNPLFPGEGSIKKMSVHQGDSPEKAPIDINFRNGQTSMEVKAEDGKIYHFHVDAAGVKVEVDSKSYYYNSKDSDGNVAAFNAQVSCECVEELMFANSTLIKNYHVGKAKYSLLPPFLIQAYCKTKGYKKAKDDEIKATIINHPKNKRDERQGPEFYIVSIPGAEDPYIIAKTHDKMLENMSYNEVGNMVVFRGLHNDILKRYLDCGFVGFLGWAWYNLLFLPKKVFHMYGKKPATLYLLLLTYSFITYLTDNTEGYFVFQVALMGSALVYAYAQERPRISGGE